MILFIDIETLPSKELPPVESVKVPANYKDPDKIKLYQVEHQVEDWKAEALDSMKGRIVAIGCAIDDEDVRIFMGEESSVMKKFAYFIEEMNDDYRTSTPVWCGWNIRSFDLKWIWRKAAQHNLISLRRATPKNNRQLHLDMMIEWGDYRDFVSLANVAKFLGIEHEGNSGSEILDLYLKGDFEGIYAHCERDILTTREIYRRLYE